MVVLAQYKSQSNIQNVIFLSTTSAMQTIIYNIIYMFNFWIGITY